MSDAERIEVAARPDAPIACDMTGADDTTAERLEEYRRLYADALVTCERTPTALVLTFAAGPGVAERVVDLLRREAACCPFLEQRLEADTRRVVWTITAPAEGGDVLDALAGAGAPRGDASQ